MKYDIVFDQKNFAVANINPGKSGVEVDNTAIRREEKHYDVTIRKLFTGEYEITAMKANYHWFNTMNGDCYDQEWIDKVIEKHVDVKKRRKYWLFGKVIEVKSVNGTCELKERQPVVYTTTNITIIE